MATFENLKIQQVGNFWGSINPELIDYDLLGMFKKKTIDQGLILKTEYFQYFDEETQEYKGLAIEEKYEPIKSGIIYVGRKTTVSWYDFDGKVAYSKEFTKKFLPWEIINFGIERRSNVTAQAKLYLLGVLGTKNAFDLLGYVNSELELYIQGNQEPLLTKVSNSGAVKAYMTPEIIQTTLDTLTLD